MTQDNSSTLVSRSDRVVEGVLALIGAILIGFFLYPGVFIDGKILSTAEQLLEISPPYNHLSPKGFRATNLDCTDEPLTFTPWALLTRKSLGRGEIPLWNVQSRLGVPFWGNIETAILDPTGFLFGFLDPLTAMSWQRTSRPILGALFLYLFLRRLGIGCLTSMAGGGVFACSGFMTVWTCHPVGGAAALMPLVLWLTDRWMCLGRRADFLGLALGVFTEIVAGHPETAVKVFSVAFAFALARGVFGRNRGLSLNQATRRILGFAGAGLAGIALAAVVLLPFMEYLLESHSLQFRSELHAPHLGRHPLCLIWIHLLPDLFGHPLTRTYPSNVLAGVPGVLNYTEASCYIGVLPWLVAPFAFSYRPRLSLFMAFVAVFSWSLAYSIPGPGSWLRAIPGLKMIILTRFLLPGDLAMAVLGAVGLEGFLRKGASRSGQVIFLGATLILSAGIATVSFNGTFDGLGRFLAILLSGVILLVLGVSRWARPGIFMLLVALLMILDPFLSASGYLPTLPRDQLYPEGAAVAFLRSRVMTGERMVSTGTAFPANTALAHGISDFGNYDAIHICDAFRTADRIFDRGLPGEAPYYPTGGRVLDLLAVRYIVSDQPLAMPDSGSPLSATSSDKICIPLSVYPGATGIRLKGRLQEVSPYRGIWGVLKLECGGEVASYPLSIPEDTVLNLKVALPSRKWRPVLARLEVHHPACRFFLDDLLLVYGREKELSAIKGWRIKKVFEGEGVFIYERPEALPRVTVVYRSRELPGRDEMLRALFERGFEPAREVMLCAADMYRIKGLSDGGEPEKSLQGGSRILALEENRVVVEADLERDGFLRLADAFFPGWTAHRLDSEGRPLAQLRILRGDGLLRVVHLPAGRHHVVFEYRPDSLRLGFFLSLLGIVFLCSVCIGPFMVRKCMRSRHSRLKVES